MTTVTDELEDRLLRAVHDGAGDLESLAHEVAASDEAQAYLVALVQTLTALSSTSPPAARAVALLEHGLAVAAEHATETHQHATAAEHAAETHQHATAAEHATETHRHAAATATHAASEGREP
jgi:hypothetical protein